MEGLKEPPRGGGPGGRPRATTRVAPTTCGELSAAPATPTHTLVEIRPFAPTDLASVYALQVKCPHAAQWRKEYYSDLADLSGGMILVAELTTSSGSTLAGFIAFHRVADEAELRNLAVLAEYRRRGVGGGLLGEGIRRLREAGTRRVFLEVRPSNHPAVALYSETGMRLTSTRKNYYHDPEEDAWIMSLDLVP